MTGHEAIGSVKEFIESVMATLKEWPEPCHPWFRGESDAPSEDKFSLRPRIAKFAEQENYLMQTFRRKAGGLANTPPFERTDLWLFLAQHHNVPTRLLDWSEGALLALFFAVNRHDMAERESFCPVVYMLNPSKLNALACDELKRLGNDDPNAFAARMGIDKAFVQRTLEGIDGAKIDPFNFPLAWAGPNCSPLGYVNIAPAWEEGGRNSGRKGIEVPMAIPATYQDIRMISQRSCFTVHGSRLEGMKGIIEGHTDQPAECLAEFCISGDESVTDTLLSELAMLGVSHASIFPDLDRLGCDLEFAAKRQHARRTV